MIEAKVVEVTLNDNYKTGINWEWISGTDKVTQDANGADGTNPVKFILGKISLPALVNRFLILLPSLIHLGCINRLGEGPNVFSGLSYNST